MTAPTTPATGEEVRPTDGSCSRWIGDESRYCCATDGVRYFVTGHCCPLHTPAALMGKPELPPGPGAGRYHPVTAPTTAEYVADG